ncbi:photosystem I subunit O isoform X1 [Vitis vinifera]|uniref:photosystem I subunit O isoform X1 n=1 Tax=Vitis vinifera TaxID=29760 RepID=UPI00288305EA|nr:photosystem I subunit O isoform X1 [Vitis vinifera]
MATTMAAASTVIGLGSSSLSPTRSSSSKRTHLASGFVKAPVAPRNPLMQAKACGGKFTCFERDWLRTDLNVIGFGLIAWLAPSSIPAIDGNSLTGLFFSSIGTELSHFPTGPALTSPFWSVHFPSLPTFSSYVMANIGTSQCSILLLTIHQINCLPLNM